MVRAALVEAGIQPEFSRALPEHPYHPSVLAEPWRVTVPADRLEEARLALARLEHDVAEEADLQSRAWHGREGLDEGEEPRRTSSDAVGGLIGGRRPKLLTALALGFVLPFPVVCLYAGARRLGALFLGLFLAGVLFALGGGIWHQGLAGIALLDGISDPAAAEDEGPARVEAVAPPDPNEAAPRTGLAALAAIEWISLLSLLAKLGDLGAGLGLIALGRRRPARAF
jgi:hypothetical protein